MLLDRSDSAFWLDDARNNEAFVAKLPVTPRLELDEQLNPTDRLRIWRVGPGAASRREARGLSDARPPRHNAVAPETSRLP